MLWCKDHAPYGEQIDTTPDTERQDDEHQGESAAPAIATGVPPETFNSTVYFGVDYKQVDFSASFDFGELFGWNEFVPKLTIDDTNLTGETRRSYNQFTNATFTEFDSGTTWMVGLRGRF